MRLNIDVATAAIILAQVLAGAPMPQAAMAEGGHAKRDQPSVVGERGPEVFVPDTSGTVVPAQPPAMTVLPPGTPMKADPRLVPASATDYYDALERNGLRLNEGAWDRWLADLPESKNIEDSRTPEQKAIDDERWRLIWDPTLVRPAKKPLKQFPPAEPEAKSTTPDWLKDQESQWLKANKKNSPSTATQ
jgi:hypothetical protein